MKEFKVRVVDNGYILIITDQNQTMLKERYDKPTKVFQDILDLLKYIKEEATSLLED